MVMRIIRLCDPRIVLATESEFIGFWKEARSAISEFLCLHPTSRTPRYDDEQCSEGDTSTSVSSATHILSHPHPRPRIASEDLIVTPPHPLNNYARPSFANYPQ